jgi:peptidoglycan/LPS O-acetylase OafA/YrhL
MSTPCESAATSAPTAQPLTDLVAKQRSQDPAPRQSARRVFQLDFLRGVAILLVLGHHMQSPPPEASVLLRRIADVWYRFGWTGVNLFFVLSGFLIGGLLFNEMHRHGGLDVRRFLVRRAFKIWPSYYVYLIIIALLMKWEMGGPPIKYSRTIALQLWPNILNIQNYFPHLMPRGHTWSLAVEEHFYLGLPWILMFLIRPSRRALNVTLVPTGLPAIVLGLILACAVARSLTVLRWWPEPLFGRLCPSHLQLDGLAIGVLLAYVHQYHRALWNRASDARGLLLLLGILLVMPMVILRPDGSRFVPSLGITLVNLGYAAILVAVVCQPLGSGLVGRFLNTRTARHIGFIGFHSYGIYLWHIDFGLAPALYLSRPHLLGSVYSHWILFFLLYMILAVAAGTAMSRLVEWPMLSLRDRLIPAERAMTNTRAAVLNPVTS